MLGWEEFYRCFSGLTCFNMPPNAINIRAMCLNVFFMFMYFIALEPVFYFVVGPGRARFIAVTLRGRPFLTYVSRCIYLASLVNVIIMCPLCTVECLARRPSRLLKPSSTVNGLLQPAWGNSAPGGEAVRETPSWLTFTDGATSSASFSFFRLNPDPVRWYWRQHLSAMTRRRAHHLLIAALDGLLCVMCVCVCLHMCICVICAYKGSIVTGPVSVRGWKAQRSDPSYIDTHYAPSDTHTKQGGHQLWQSSYRCAEGWNAERRRREEEGGIQIRMI